MLAPITKGPYLVKQIDTEPKTLVIARKDKEVENISRSRVVLAPYQLTAD